MNLSDPDDLLERELEMSHYDSKSPPIRKNA